MIDIHQHVTVDVAAQIARAREAGVDRVVLLRTGVHPEAAGSLDELRGEFARLTRVIGGRQVGDSRDADAEVDAALASTRDTVTMVKPPASSYEQLLLAVEQAVRSPRTVGLGELTPPPGQAAGIEPFVRASADTAVDGTALPVLGHGFAPNTAEDLRAYADLAGRYPSVPIIIGAFGGLNSLLAIDLAIAHRNLYLDLSSALQVFMVAVALVEVPEQCLFGSNTPYGDVLASRVTVEAAARDRSALRLALGGNAARLFGLPDAADSGPEDLAHL